MVKNSSRINSHTKMEQIKKVLLALVLANSRM